MYTHRERWLLLLDRHTPICRPLGWAQLHDSRHRRPCCTSGMAVCCGPMNRRNECGKKKLTTHIYQSLAIIIRQPHVNIHLVYVDCTPAMHLPVTKLSVFISFPSSVFIYTRGAFYGPQRERKKRKNGSRIPWEISIEKCGQEEIRRCGGSAPVRYSGAISPARPRYREEPEGGCGEIERGRDRGFTPMDSLSVRPHHCSPNDIGNKKEEGKDFHNVFIEKFMIIRVLFFS